MNYNPNKIVIFDWCGIVESHDNDENNYHKVIISIINSLNPNICKSEIIPLWKICLYDENKKIISECNTLEEIQKWFDRVKKAYNLKCDFKTFCEVYKKEFKYVDYYKDVVSLEHETKNKCKIGILSNLTFLDKERINEQLNLTIFDYVWLSCDLGITKPNDKIYDIVENDCNLKPQNILFIDDNEDNILAARKRKWNTCNAFGYEIDKLKHSIKLFLN